MFSYSFLFVPFLVQLLCDDEEDLRPGQITSDRFKALIQLRSLTALSPPGESVGLLAAQVTLR